jgi:nitrogen fixation protein FixH
MADRGRPLTGRGVLAIFVGAFAVIVGANLTLAWFAVGTFPGIEVANGYIASQRFDRERAAQQALGWTLTPAYDGQRVTLAFAGADGVPVAPAELRVRIGRSTASTDDQWPDFTGARGVYSAPVALGRGQWLIRVEARAADGTQFRQRRFLYVDG